MFLIVNNPPDTRLRPYIKTYFGARTDEAPKSQRIVPNGEMGLCFYRGEPVLYSNTGTIRSCISGQTTSYSDIMSEGKIDIVGVHFTTLGAASFFSIPLHDFHGGPTPLTDLYDEDYLRLEEKIMSTPDYTECFHTLNSFFLRRIEHAKIDMLNLRRLQRAIAYGQHHTSSAHVSDIAAEACLSQRHFARLFSEAVGLSPKEYLRIKRYQKTLTDLKGIKPDESMSDIAWRNGYCDFSHMTSDFRNISGYSPSELIVRSRNDNDDFGWRL